MKYYMAVYSSVTVATRVKKNLRKDGAYVGVVHTPKTLTKGGCSYALKFKPAKLSEVKDISRDLGIAIKDIYKEDIENGEKIYTLI
jgi:hypothetical protein